jgi:hypothetical protein
MEFVSDLVFSTNKTEILLKVALNTKNPPSNKQTKTHVKYFDYVYIYTFFNGGFLVFNATFNNISVLLVEKTKSLTNFIT